MVLAVVDDLMFTSKIRAAARPLGATLTFARSREAALAEMRNTAPALVILDLDNPRTDPLGIIAEMKADPSLGAVKSVAYVSHVRADLIERAKQAGVDLVLPRSAFVAQLGFLFQNS